MRLERAEIERVKRKPTESLDAYDYFLRGMACFHRPPFANREAIIEAFRLYNQAIDFDNEFAAAYAMAAYCYATRKGNGYIVEAAREPAEAARLAQRAIELGRDDALASGTGGFVLAYVIGDLDTGVALITTARKCSIRIWRRCGFTAATSSCGSANRMQQSRRSCTCHAFKPR